MPTYSDPVKNAQYSRDYYLAHKEEYAARGRSWSSKNKERRVQHTMTWRAKNSDRHKQYQKEWREKNRARIEEARIQNKHKQKGYEAAYNNRHPGRKLASKMKRRALERASTINLESIQQWMQSVKSGQSFVCYYCGKRFPVENLHFDHIVPLSRGGPHSVENLCASCSGCNWSKGDKPLRVWTRIGQQVLEL